jgi:hypothetical protein
LTTSLVWALPTHDVWFSRRDLAVSVTPANCRASTVVVTARVVWIPERLRIPAGERSVVVVLEPAPVAPEVPGNNREPAVKILARVSDPRELAALVAEIDALPPDEAVRAVYMGCPPTPRPELRLTFANAAGATVAAIKTLPCPDDALLSVPGHGSQLVMAGGTFRWAGGTLRWLHRPLVAQLDRTLGVHIPTLY